MIYPLKPSGKVRSKDVALIAAALLPRAKALSEIGAEVAAVNDALDLIEVARQQITVREREQGDLSKPGTIRHLHPGERVPYMTAGDVIQKLAEAAVHAYFNGNGALVAWSAGTKSRAINDLGTLLEVSGLKLVRR